MITLTITLVLLALAAALLGRQAILDVAASRLDLSLRVYSLKAQLAEVQEDLDDAENCAAALRHELNNIRLRRHTVPTINMLEDLSAVNLDLRHELKLFEPHLAYLVQLYNYVMDGISRQETIVSKGRPGPYSYLPGQTDKRPARPGAGPNLWSL